MFYYLKKKKLKKTFDRYILLGIVFAYEHEQIQFESTIGSKNFI